MSIRDSRSRNDAGSITVWLAMISLTVITCVGMAVDLGGQVLAHERAHDLAAQAARAGAEQVQAPAAIEGTTVTIAPAAARAAAEAYLKSAGVTGTVTVTSGTTITVTVTESYRPRFLELIGVTHLNVIAHASADLIRTVGGKPR